MCIRDSPRTVRPGQGQTGPTPGPVLLRDVYKRQQLGGTPLTGLSKDLGASDFMLGLLMALPVFGNLTQLLFSYVLERTCKRKRCV